MSSTKKVKVKRKTKIVKENFVPIKQELALVPIKPKSLQEMPKIEVLKQVAKSISFVTIIGIIIAYISLLVIVATSIFYAERLQNGKIQTGVYIHGIDVSDLTQEEAVNSLVSQVKELAPEFLNLHYKEMVYQLKLSDLELNYDFEEAAQEAYSIGRTKNVVQDFRDYIRLMNQTENIEITLDYKDDILNDYINQITEQFPDKVQEHSYVVENNTLIINNGKSGVTVNQEELKKIIIANLQSQNYEKIEIPTVEVLPQEIDLQKIHDEIYKAPQDAYVTENPFEIHEQVIGVDFDIEEVQNEINNDKSAENYKVNLSLTNPNIFVKDLNIFTDMLSTFSTNYVNNPNRTTNLRIAAQKISGTVLMPDEVFSYNNIVGERTVAAGYKNAAIFVNGGVEDGLAGGICQVSSTLYNAVIGANLEIVERHNHSQLTSYLPGGKDATVVWGRYDFQFKNSRSYPIRIDMSVENGIANATFYGIRENDEYSEISIESYQSGVVGMYKAYNAYKVYKQNEVEVKREFLSRDLYK